MTDYRMKAEGGHIGVKKTTTFDDSDLSEKVVLSGGTLTANGDSVRSICGHSSGVYHVEFTLDDPKSAAS